MKKILIKKFDYYLIFLVIAAFVFYNFNNFFIWLPNYKIFGHLIFNWPDSNANYFFSQLFAESFHFFQFEPLNLLTDNLLHTRSINVVAANLVPMTWLWSLIIFALPSFLGPLSVLFLTPVLAAISVILFYRLVTHIFASDALAFLSAALLAFFAPWLFFANEVMLPNVLFITCLLSALYLFSRCDARQVKNTNKTFILASVFFCLALMMRLNELLWLFILLGFLGYYFYAYLTRKKILIFFIVAFIFVGLTLLLNKLTYGAYLAFGYLNLQTSTLPTEFVQENFNLLKFWQFLILPFGWQTKVFLSNIYHYLFLLIWPYYIFAAIALWSIFKNKNLSFKIWSRYLLLSFVLSLVILIYYANWELADPMVKSYNGISISYVRYFLPIYILILPFVALGILSVADYLADKFKKCKKIKLVSSLVLVLCLSIFSLRLAFFAPNDGLLKTKDNILVYYQQFQAVKNIVPASSVLLTDRSDKIFFPYFAVIVPQGDLPLWSRIAKLRTAREVFYFSDKSEAEIAAMNKEAINFDLELVQMTQVDEKFKLFIIISTN